MSEVDAVYEAKRAEFNKDQGRCHYCGGYAYVAVGNWVAHLFTEHPDTIRTRVLQDAITEAAEREQRENA